MVQIKRVYEAPAPGDGLRVLVDRLWPRGLTKEKAAVDLWLKAVSPSTALRQWSGHATARWPEFQSRYRAELAEPEPVAALAELVARAKAGPLTLLFAARNEQENNAAVLREVVLERLGG